MCALRTMEKVRIVPGDAAFGLDSQECRLQGETSSLGSPPVTEGAIRLERQSGEPGTNLPPASAVLSAEPNAEFEAWSQQLPPQRSESFIRQSSVTHCHTFWTYPIRGGTCRSRHASQIALLVTGMMWEQGWTSQTQDIWVMSTMLIKLRQGQS